MRVFLHIGVWKTGSTAIQAFLRENTPALHRAGIAAPMMRGRQNLAYLANGDDAPLAAALDQIWAHAAASNAHTLIFSTEHFWPLPGAAQDRLAAALAARGAEVSVLVYLRPQADLWRSLLAQQAKTFRVRRGEPMWGDVSFVGRQMARHAFYYGACLSRFRRRFGAVDARRYVRSEFPGGDVVRDFADSIAISDLPGLSYRAGTQANLSLGWKGVALSVAIADSNQKAVGSRLRRAALITATSAMADHQDDKTWLGNPPNFLTDEDVAAINQHYAPDTKKLARRFFGGNIPFVSATPAPVDPFGPDHLSAAEMAEAMSLYRRALIFHAPGRLLKHRN